ncbi:MAG TPA: TlpA disulfide reductase family protein [Gaiellaceae bacterium]|nr:TlpA disulfide reductase family protein [Gaiellaceae bacterium]
MTGRAKLIGQVAALACVAGLLALLVWKLTHQQHAPPVGSQAPMFSLPLLDPGPDPTGDDVSLSAFRGRGVVLNFWASWCIPCKSEAPVLEKYYLRYGRRVTFLGIDYHDLASDARTFVDAHGLKFPMLADGSGDVTSSYGISQVPETYVLNASGKIVAHLAGPISSSEFASAFRAALKEVS